MTLTQAQRKAELKYPADEKMREAYLQGFTDASVKCKSDAFYKEAATKLRELWPTGEKDGKYAWRDSIPVLSKRIKFIWEENNLEDKYTIDDILRAGRIYLSRYQESTKYMQICKYFIFKQDKIVKKNGEITYSYKSTLCNILESNEMNEILDTFDSPESVIEPMEMGVLI